MNWLRPRSGEHRSRSEPIDAYDRVDPSKAHPVVYGRPIHSCPRRAPRAQIRPPMCNLYSIDIGQQAIRDIAKAMRDVTGNMPSLPGVLPSNASAGL
jgi:hypothetical protein